MALSLTLFFIYLADAILSFWVPGFIERTLSSSIAMGFVLSFSSIIGLGTDLTLPQLLRGITVKKLMFLGIFTSLFFSLTFLGAIAYPFIILLLIGMALWGLYYEFLGFAGQQFVADTIPLKLRSSGWAIIGIFKNLAYFLGPILGGWLVLSGDKVPPLVAMFFALIGLLILVVSGVKHERPLEFDVRQVSLTREFEHWGVLFSRVWPVVIMSIFMGLIDAFFWTTGTIYTVRLARESWLGGLFLPFYTLPSLFVGFWVAKWHIYEGKKKLAQKLLLLAGLFLVGLIVSDNIFWILGMVFLSSLMLAIVYPLVDGVYSDIVARLGRVRHHMIGLSNSTTSLAYVLGPIIAGFVTSWVGEKNSFVVIGAVIILISVILLLVTPKKLKLPQDMVKSWEK
jgi:MFS family permease